LDGNLIQRCWVAYKTMKIALIGVSFILASCTQNYYMPDTSDTTATVSFSNLSAENPEINIIDNCRSSEIESIYIERKKPSKVAKYKITIPAERKISFQYKYFWISGEKTTLVTSSVGSLPQIKPETSKEIATCDEVITFKPEKNKHYVVYFGVGKNKCVIKANEILYDRVKGANKLYAIDMLANQEC